jgi:isoquinoline 1-oxidoreductase beta subunit
MNNAPSIEVPIVQNIEPPGGMSEPGTSAIIPAITNAIFAATDKRLRKLSIDPAELKDV